MNKLQLPKYAISKQKGNLGEAFVQFVMSKYSLVHTIDGSNDIGNDFICELIKHQYPTNILFYIQVKFTRGKPKIKQTTKNYWKDSPIPVYIFHVKELKIKRGKLIWDFLDERYWSIKYKRVTPELQKNVVENYKIYSKNRFIRDLIIDYMRTLYWKGVTPIVKTSDFIRDDERVYIRPTEYNLLLRDVIQEAQYSERIISTSWAQLLSLAIIYYERFKKNKKMSDIETAKKSIELAGDIMYDNKKVPEVFLKYEVSLNKQITNEYKKSIKNLND